MAVQNPQGGGGSANAVVNNPALAATNTIQPTADVVALTLKMKAGGVANLAEFYNAAGALAVRMQPSGLLGNPGNTTYIDFNGGFIVCGAYLQSLGVIYIDGGNLNIRDGASGVAINTVAANNIFTNKLLSTDAQPAFNILGNGRCQWGPGGATVVDTNLYRNSAGVLKTDGALITGGNVTIGGGNALIFTNGAFSEPSANLISLTQADLTIGTLGRGLRVKEGANAKQGVATLVTGTVVVANTSVTATSRIFLTPQDNNTTGVVRVSARTAGTSFTITSTLGTDTGVIAYEIFEQG